MCIIDKHGED